MLVCYMHSRPLIFHHNKQGICMMLYASKVHWSNARHIVHFVQIEGFYTAHCTNTNVAQAGRVTLIAL